MIDLKNFGIIKLEITQRLYCFRVGRLDFYLAGKVTKERYLKDEEKVFTKEAVKIEP